MTATLINAVGWALIHFVWQGALVALLLAAVLALVPRRAATARYAAGCAALLVLAILPITTAVLHHPTPAASGAMPAAQLDGDLAVVLRRESAMGAVASGGREGAIGAALEAIERHADHLVLVWALGVIITSARVLTGLRHLAHLTESAEPATAEWTHTFERLRRTIGVRAPVRLLTSHRVDVPCALGFFEPIVLVPFAVLSGLSTRELELILAHELAHIRRHDYLVNIVQTGVETLLFYHPAVWWVSHVIRTERENCCDDVAVRVAPTPVAYARALTALETLRVSPTLAVSAAGSPLGARVRRLVMPEAKQVSRFSAGVSMVTLASALALALPAIAVPSRAADQPAPAAEPATTTEASPGTRGGAQDVPAATPAPSPAAKPQPTPAAKPQPAPAAKPQPAPAVAPGVSAPGVHIHEQAGRDHTAADRAVVGRDQLTVDQLVGLRTAGVDRTRAEALAALGIEPTVGTLVDLAQAGVTPERVKALQALFGDQLTTAHLIDMSHLGVTSEYVQELTALGLRATDPQLAMDARAVGVTASWARALKTAGLPLADLRAAIDLRALGVDGPYLDELAAAGVRGLSPAQVEELRGIGVTGRFAKELADAGLVGATPAELVELRALGVDASFVGKMKAAGLEKPSAADLVRLKEAGVTPEYLEQLRRH